MLNNQSGFVINFNKERHAPNYIGSCVRENCEKIADFWKKGWIQTRLFITQIKRIDGKLIKHVNIYNEKTGKIIDVSNGFIKILDMEQWRKSNEIVKIASVDINMFQKINVQLLVDISDYLFMSYNEGNDNWKSFEFQFL